MSKSSNGLRFSELLLMRVFYLETKETVAKQESKRSDFSQARSIGHEQSTCERKT